MAWHSMEQTLAKSISALSRSMLFQAVSVQRENKLETFLGQNPDAVSGHNVTGQGEGSALSACAEPSR